MKETPRMVEIAARVVRALDAVRDKLPDRDDIVKEFHRRSMEDIVYLLGKLGVVVRPKT